MAREPPLRAARMALREFDGITLKPEPVRRNSSRRSDLTHPGDEWFPTEPFS
jgi:hypothetical protein